MPEVFKGLSRVILMVMIIAVKEYKAKSAKEKDMRYSPEKKPCVSFQGFSPSAVMQAIPNSSSNEL